MADSLAELADFRYCVFQLERGAEGTEHFQMLLEFSKKKTFATVRRETENSHVAMTKHRLQARAYCQKEDTRVEGPWERGVWEPVGQGKRTDLSLLIERVREGETFRELIDDEEVAPTAVRYGRHLERVRALAPDPQWASGDDSGPHVVLIMGPPGVGKTELVMRECPDVFKKPLSGNWFDGYDGHKTLLFDDFAGAQSHVRLDEFLNFVDRRPCQLPVKGAFVPRVSAVIAVTTNINPALWWEWEKRTVQFWALARRFDVVYAWDAAHAVFKRVERESPEGGWTWEFLAWWQRQWLLCQHLMLPEREMPPREFGRVEPMNAADVRVPGTAETDQPAAGGYRPPAGHFDAGLIGVEGPGARFASGAAEAHAEYSVL